MEDELQRNAANEVDIVLWPVERVASLHDGVEFGGNGGRTSICDREFARSWYSKNDRIFWNGCCSGENSIVGETKRRVYRTTVVSKPCTCSLEWREVSLLSLVVVASGRHFLTDGMLLVEYNFCWKILMGLG